MSKSPSAFLNGRLNKDVYMVQPEGFVNPKYPRRVCKLQRSIYGLKQASRSYNKRFNEELKKYGFTQNPNEPCVYKRASGSIIVFLILYVDDILITGNNIPMLQDVKFWPGKCFAMKDLAEYIAAAEAAMEAIWIRKFISGLGVVPSIDKPMDMYCDNTGAITIADESGVQKGAKHFRQKYYFIQEVIQEGDIRILKVHTDNNLSEPFTKPMPCTKHVEHVRSIGLRPAGSFM
ncbi:retrotransposon protein, putative, ty1-copia subclass [Tanacetum coccineum]